jgi:Leucine-rich repeat (LRR) protein
MADLSACSYLTIIKLSQNKLGGSLDSFNLPASVASLSVDLNNFTSVDLAGLDKLQVVDVSHNSLASFPLPPTGLVSVLETFGASGCGLVGRIPDAFNYMSAPSLRTLALTDNRLTGPLPKLWQIARLYIGSNPFRSSLSELLSPNMWEPTSFGDSYGPNVSLTTLDVR